MHACCAEKDEDSVAGRESAHCLQKKRGINAMDAERNEGLQRAGRKKRGVAPEEGIEEGYIAPHTNAVFFKPQSGQ